MTLIRALDRFRRRKSHGRLGPTAGRPAGRAKKPTARGYTGRGQGRAVYVAVPNEARGTTVQVCGLWPFAAGSSLPSIGVPKGRRLATGGAPVSGTVCCDPISWFVRAKLISNPSQFVLGLPGLGKSTWVRRDIVGLDDYGVHSLVLGDLKPDYVDVIRAIGGQVAPIGRGRGYINVLDRRDALRAADRLRQAAAAVAAVDPDRARGLREAAVRVLEDAHSRRTTMLGALLTLMRKRAPEDREEAILDRALHLVDARCAQRVGVPWSPDAQQPLIQDLLDEIQGAHPDLRQVAIDRGSLDRYQEITEALEASLTALIHSGRFGGLFSRYTSESARPYMDRSLVYDVSAIPDTERDLQAAVLLTCWSVGFGNINIQHELADAGLEPQRNYHVVMDELWRILRSGPTMVDRADGLTRLNRNEGVAQSFITHTMKDLELESPADAEKARGFVERAGMVVCAGLPPEEIVKLNRIVRISDVEANLLTSWTTPAAWDSVSGAPGDPPGRGNFLIKVGGSPGIPLHLDLVPAELAWNDTNKRWAA